MATDGMLAFKNQSRELLKETQCAQDNQINDQETKQELRMTHNQHEPFFALFSSSFYLNLTFRPNQTNQTYR